MFCNIKIILYLCNVIKERLQRTGPEAEKRKV